MPVRGRPSGLEVWATPSWRQEATAWVDECLAEHQLARTGEVTQPHLHAWATVLRVPTSGGAVWLKAPGPATAFEVRLYPLLYAAAPEHVLSPLAVDPDRAWLLLPDGGTPLGELARGAELARALETAVAGYARLQRRMAPGVEPMIGIGLVDLRPGAIPARFAECLADVTEYAGRRGEASEVETVRRLHDRELLVCRWAEELAASAVPASLDHNDLHPRNLLCPRADITEARAYDWGDAVVGHPFASLTVTLRWLTEQEGLAPDSVEVTRVRDAYLAEFADLAPRGDLLGALALADRIARIGRALSWMAVQNATGDRMAGDHADAPLWWLSTLLA